jgi:hypothetical protein
VRRTLGTIPAPAIPEAGAGRNKMYAIYSSDLKGISLSGDFRTVNDWYNEHKKYYRMPGSSYYGSVMAETKRTKQGATIKIRFFTSFWTWKPELRWKYDYSFHWLWFHFHFEWEYFEKYFRTVQDALKDAPAETERKPVQCLTNKGQNTGEAVGS